MGDLRLRIQCGYYNNFCQTCDVRQLHNRISFCYKSRGSSRSRTKTEDYSRLDLQELFGDPGGLKKFLESQNQVKKYQFVEAFISFLLQLLNPDMRQLPPAIMIKFKDQIENLEEELRFLLTILGDSSLLLCECDDEHEEFQKLRAEFEAVAIEAASLVCFLVRPSDRRHGHASGVVEREFAVVLNHLDHLKTNIKKSLDLLSSISRSAYTTPKTSVVDSLLIVDSLIHDLEDLMNREDNPIADVKDQIKRLHKWLTVVQSSIKDTESPQPSEIGELKERLMRIGDMAYAAEYLVISFLVGDAPVWYLIPRLININESVEHIGTELREITKKYQSGGLAVAEYFTTPLPLQANANTEVSDVTVGFEDNEREILDLLVGGTERLQVISIFGMPGLGKTTLAKILYNHLTVRHRFDKLSWCVVSQIYHRKGVLTDILINLTTELGKDSILKMDEEKLLERIYKTLKRRRYLIVMDDIWDSNVWDDLQRCFPDDGNGSRILFTNRNKDVAPPNSIIYELPSLSKDQCWELLEKKVFHHKLCPPKLQRIGKEIAASCCGLPLAVVVIAGILSNMDRKRSIWEEVGENLASYIFDGDNSSVMQILELSYKHLPDHLKPCFLYFGAFNEDKEIPARKIMRLWVAQGFICKEKEKSIDDVAEEYLRQLIDKSLVMVAKRRSDGGVQSCVIHDSLRDLCLRICENDNFLKLEMMDATRPFYRPFHLPVGSRTRDSGLSEIQDMLVGTLTDHFNDRIRGRIVDLFDLNAIDEVRKERRTENESRTLLELGCSATWSYGQHMRSFHGRWLTRRLYVREMRLLRILDSELRSNQLIGIEYLVNLRYLVIFDDFLASIGGLVNLEYLRVLTNKRIYLPPAIVKMRKLRYILVERGSAKYGEQCNSSQPNSLEHLSGIRIVSLKDEEMLKCSPHLRKLKCRYQVNPMEKRAYPHFDLRFLTQLDSLTLTFSEVRTLEEFGFPSNIRKLTLCESKFHWEMSIIGRLENLEVLKLDYEAFVGERWDTRDGEFQKLAFLKLEAKNLTEWNVESSQHFPKLKQLVLKDCHNLEEIPCEIGDIPTLQLIQVTGKCQKSLVESAQRIQQEQCEDFGNEELRVIISATVITPEVIISATVITPEVNKDKRVLQKLFRSCFQFLFCSE